jgi:predicted TIM-barrel fold metal-dependent hydrolase
VQNSLTRQQAVAYAMPPKSPLPDLNTRTPKTPVPKGACDTHAHIFGPMDRYPPKEKRRYDPPDAGIERFRTMLDTLGVERAVMVQSSAYGIDNSALLDGIAAAGDNFRGIALVDPDIDQAELKRLDSGGIRGVRASTLANAPTGASHMPALARRIADLGWVFLVHLQHISELPQVAALIPDLPVPCVIDNFGRIRGDDTVDNSDFQALLRVFEQNENCWIKLCSFYRLSDAGPPGYDDMAVYTRAFVETCPDRLIWGTNWPHPHCPVAIPNDGDLFDILFGWIDDDAARQKILVDNPARLFGFAG